MDGHGLILLVDAGNTRIKFGWLCAHTGKREAETLALGHTELEGLATWLDALPARPFRSIGVSVTSSTVASAIDAALQQQAIPAVEWLRSSSEIAGVRNLYGQPEQLGPDRWISLVGLSPRAKGAAVLATFGTATTVDTLGPAQIGNDQTAAAPARRFEGGVILPGPELMRRSLADGTAGLPYAEGELAAFPRNTHSAIVSGIAAAQAGAVMRQWRRALDLLGTVPQLYCAGGAWPLVAEEIKHALATCQADCGVEVRPPEWLHAPVLDGLAVIARAR